MVRCVAYRPASACSMQWHAAARDVGKSIYCRGRSGVTVVLRIGCGGGVRAFGIVLCGAGPVRRRCVLRRLHVPRRVGVVEVRRLADQPGVQLPAAGLWRKT